MNWREKPTGFDVVELAKFFLTKDLFMHQNNFYMEIYRSEKSQ